MMNTNAFLVNLKSEDSKPRKEKVIFIDKKGNVRITSWDKVRITYI